MFDMPPRNRISLQHRERVVGAFENDNEDYLLVADTLGVNRSTARGTVARYVPTGRIAERPRGGRNHIRVDDEMRDCFNPLRPNNDVSQTSHRNIKGVSVSEVMRIDNMITPVKFY